MSRRLAIIPARGGSKRIPRKNIIDFEGRPMIAWSIEAALKTKLFEHVLVSTDCKDIAACAREAGAVVPFLRNDHSDDHSTVSEATLTALGQAEAYWNKPFDTVVQLMANCPLRSAEDIASAVTNFETASHEFQISAFEFGWMNPWWAMRRKKDGRAERLFKENPFARSQDLETLYCPTGAIWITTSLALKRHKTFYGPDYIIHPIKWESALDIDDIADLHLAQAVFYMQRQDKINVY